MSEEKQPSNGRLIALTAGLAMIGGLVAGAGVLYVTGRLDGNAALASAATCSADPAMAEALEARATGEVAAVSPVPEPFNVSQMAFTGADGEAVTIGDFAGKSLLVNLWATWCVPCRVEMPALDELERQQGGDDFAVVPISVDQGGPEKPKAFYAETNLTALPFFHDASMGVFNAVKSQGTAIGLPVSLLVDEEGCVRAAVAGPAEWASPDAVRLIEALKGVEAGV